MAKLSLTLHIPFLNTLLLFKEQTSPLISNIQLFQVLISMRSSIPITPTATNRYVPSDDPTFINLMVLIVTVINNITLVNITF